MLLNSVGCQLCEIRSQVLDLTLDVVPERAVHRRRQVGDQRLRVALRRLRDQHRLTFCRKFEHRVHLLEKNVATGSTQSNKLQIQGAAVEHMPRDREDVGSNPAGCCFFLLFPILSAVRL